MKVGYFPKQITTKKTTLILGGFETIHNGHMELIKKAKSLKAPIAMMIIENNQDLPNNSKNSFSTLNIRLQQIANLGINFVSVVKFDQSILEMDGKDFLEKISKSVNAQEIVVGKDFAMGKNRTLTSSIIPNSHIVEPLKVNEKKISTSLLKEFLPIGEVDLIKELSPNPFTMSFKVNSEGIALPDIMLDLHPGIYAIYGILNDIKYFGLMHVDLNKYIYIELPNLVIKNTGYNSMVEIHKLTRKIIVDKKDLIDEEDWDSVKKWLSYHD